MTGIEELPNGQWVVAGDSHLGLWAKKHGTIVTDPHLFKFLKPRMAAVKTVWDIGANIGDHARQYLDWGMTVVAVEPNPITFECLRHNCPEATCLNVAASDNEDRLKFTQLVNVGASRVTPDGSLEIPAIRMDALMDLPRPDFVKIDVEGWEVSALKGMLTTLRENKPIIYIEINRGALAANGKTPEDIMAILEDDLGYSDFTMYPGEANWSDPQFDILAK